MKKRNTYQVHVETYQADVEGGAEAMFGDDVKYSTLRAPDTRRVTHIHFLAASLGKQHVFFQRFHFVAVHLDKNV